MTRQHHPANRQRTLAFVARESSRVGARDERFGAEANRMDRIRGDRFGDGANPSRAGQLTRAAPAIRATQPRGRPSPPIDPALRGRPTRREAIARRMPLASSSSARASPGRSSSPPTAAGQLTPGRRGAVAERPGVPDRAVRVRLPRCRADAAVSRAVRTAHVPRPQLSASIAESVAYGSEFACRVRPDTISRSVPALASRLTWSACARSGGRRTPRVGLRRPLDAEASRLSCQWIVICVCWVIKRFPRRAWVVRV